MKPTRGLSYSWISSLPKERKTAMGATAFLVVALGILVLYQRLTGAPPGTQESLITPPAMNQPTQHLPNPAVSGAQPAGGVSAGAAGDAGAGAVKAEAAQSQAPRQLMQPLAGERNVLQSYGFVDSEVYGDFRLHPGVDFAASAGESVLAAAEGKVTAIEADPVEGTVVQIQHGGSVITRYGGLGKVMVGLNAAVQPGSIIGQVGDPTVIRQRLGTHLYYEVLVGGSPVDPVAFSR